MLPDGLTLESGRVHIRVSGSGLGRKHFDTSAELRQWAETEPYVRFVHLVLYFARDNSGKPTYEVMGDGVYMEDNGEYVAIRATGEGKCVVDAALAVAEAREASLKPKA